MNIDNSFPKKRRKYFFKFYKQYSFGKLEVKEQDEVLK